MCLLHDVINSYRFQAPVEYCCQDLRIDGFFFPIKQLIMTMYFVWLPTLLMYRWNKLVQKPFEDGDVRGLKFLQTILKLLMLWHTKRVVTKMVGVVKQVETLNHYSLMVPRFSQQYKTLGWRLQFFFQDSMQQLCHITIC